VTGLPFAPVLAKPLPWTVRPFHRETTRSYLERLAAANWVPAHRLITPSHWIPTSLSLPELVALLSGHDQEALERALPDLARRPQLDLPPMLEKDTAWACRRCAAQTGSRRPIRVWSHRPPSQVCPRHRIWIGQGVDTIGQQFDVAHLPRIGQAQIRFDRLSRRRGRSTTAKAFERSYPFVRSLAKSAGRLQERHPQVRRFSGSPRWDAGPPWTPQRSAALYPDVVELTALLTSPHWRHRILSPLEAETSRFMAEFQTRLPIGPPLRTTRLRGWTSRLVNIAEEVERTARRTGEQKHLV
jgi:hypothetical protein